MAIANELSSDVAAAVLSYEQNRDPGHKRELKEMLLNFYTTLRTLTTESRRRRLRTNAAADTSPGAQSVSGNH